MNKNQKPTRRQYREAALQVLYSHFFLSKGESASIAGVRLALTSEEFQIAAKSLSALAAESTRTQGAIGNALSAFDDLVKPPEERKSTRKPEDLLQARLALAHSQAEAVAALKAALAKVETTNILFAEDGFAIRLLAHYHRADQRVENILARCLEGWTVRRLTAELRGVLSLGTVELVMFHDVPEKVIVDEYVELARMYADQEGSRLCNGVLDRVMREYPREARS
jgi:N utilization substance protein B